jgi:hypothetical protein
MPEQKPSIEQRLAAALNPQPEAAPAKVPVAPPEAAPEPVEIEAEAPAAPAALEVAEATPEAPSWMPERLEDIAEAGGWNVADLYNMRVKVTGPDGKAQEVSLGEWKDAYQQSSQLAALKETEKRRSEELIAQRQQVINTINQRAIELDALTKAAESRLIGGYQAIDWNALRQHDPAEWAAKRAEFIEAANGLATVKQQAMQQVQAQMQHLQAEQAQQYQQYITEQLQEARALIPEMAVPEKAPAVQQETVSWLRANRYSDFEIGLVSQSAKLLKLVRDKMALSKADTDSKKVQPAPKKFLKPGTAGPAQSKQAEAYKSARAKLRKSGKLEDAAALFRTLGG